jgi:hypothetical protein
MEIKKELQSFFTEHWKYMAVSTACELNIFDHLTEYKTAPVLAKELNLDLDKLIILLNALSHIQFLDQVDGLYIVNSKSVYLTEKHPESLKYACLNWYGEHLTVWQNLKHTISTGKSTFQHLFGMPFFDYLKANPTKLNNYHKGMYAYALDDYKGLSQCINWNKHKSVMDIGGGYGALIQVIHNNYPSIDTILFDLNEVVKNLQLDNINIIGGNFFEGIPPLAEAFILSRVLHDWDDEKAVRILENCYCALPQNGCLYIIENCSDYNQIDLSLLSLNMAAMCESYERSSVTYKSLASQTGFTFQEAVKLNELQTILIFTK